LTIRSSSEWKVMTENRPPSLKQSIPEARPRARLFSSSLTAIRSAWKLRVAGWILPWRMGAGMAAAMRAASSSVVSIGAVFLLSTMALAMRRACRSSP